MASTSTTTISETNERFGYIRRRKGKEKEMNIFPGPPPLANLLGAGTLSLPLHDLSFFRSKELGEDGWYILRNFADLLSCAREDHAILLAYLQSLQSGAFIQTTYTIQANDTLCIRIYLVPYDLPGYIGALRNRDETNVMIQARKALRYLLSQVSRSPTSWMGRSGGEFIPFFKEIEVIIHSCFNTDKSLIHSV